MFYYKILVWLFFVVLAMISACVPLIWLVIFIGLWDIEEANKRITLVFKIEMCSNKSAKLV